MQQVDDFLKLIDSYIGSAGWFPFALLGVGLFFTIYLKFPQIRYLLFAIKVVKGKYDKDGDEGDTSHFQALTTALSGTVGTGNIAGVAFAIHLGGPAALFWMLVTASIGACTKFVEVTLSHKYREKAEDGSMAGGPMYFMKNGIAKKFGKGGSAFKWMAGIFAVATVLSSFGTGSMPQINNIADTMNATFGLQHIVTGAVLAVVLAFVIIGGIKRIAQVTEKLVPGMAILYFIGAIAVILYNASEIGPSFAAIFGDIFTGSAATGGFLGGSIAYAFNRGVNRGLFSNEAGQGSAPIAHASAKAHEPVSEGMVAILEPFIDTIIICTLTGLVLLSSGVWNQKVENEFAFNELEVLTRVYDDTNAADKEALFKHLDYQDRVPVPVFTGELNVTNGRIENNLSIIHARSIAEDMVVTADGAPYTGSIKVDGGVVVDAGITITGKSLVHSARLTAEAFKKGFFGAYGEYIVTIGLLMFAFSTAISWSYYGDRAMTYLFGSKSIVYYRVVYVIGFFVAAIAPTQIIWTLSGIAIALMTIPNLIGLLVLHRDMRDTVNKYWESFRKEWGK